MDGIHHVRRDRADDDQVDLLQVEGMDFQQLLDRFDGEVAGGNALVGNVALANARALQDPLVGGLDHVFQVLIGEDARRDVGSERSDFGANRTRTIEFSSNNVQQ